MKHLLMVLIYFQFTLSGYSWFSYKDDAKYGSDLLCSQLSQFLPNFCQYPAVNRTCRKICGSKEGDTGRLQCGKRQVPPKPRRFRRIVGGNYSVPGEWPWRVGLIINNNHWCGGSLLSEYFVLTAWHCFTPNTSLNAFDWIVVSGENTLLLGDDNKQVVRVRKLIRHSEGKLTLFHSVKKGEYASIEEDIAILALDQPIKFDGVHRSPICLPDTNQPITANQKAYVSGWGMTDFPGKVSKQLRHARVPVVSMETCNSEVAYNNTINGDKVLCAGYEDGGIDACYFDSGGSLDYKVKDRWYAIGIVSSGWECARPNAYGLYTRVSNYLEWIIDAVLFKTDL